MLLVVEYNSVKMSACYDSRNEFIMMRPYHSCRQVLGGRCVQCDVSSARMALFTFCVMRRDSAKRHICGGLRTPAGSYDPQIGTRPRFLYDAPTPSFIMLCRLIRKLSCWQTNRQTHPRTHKQTNRQCPKHPTFFATLQHWVINTMPSCLLPSARQHSSYGDCLEVKREHYQNCSVLDCVTQCSQSAAHLCDQFLEVKQIGFITLGPLRCA